MNFEVPEADIRLSEGFINLQAHCSSCLNMDVKARPQGDEGQKLEHQHYHQRSSLYRRSLSHVLMILAFMPSNVRDLTYTYV
ncbi:hypothetical protein M0R45_002889 [Rubus argutus]|uniref:Uncharacterized protein n=1 Tax=Rubus argutus TaxID=59490 RepID=A0AAW1YDD8_RUBAR